MSAAAVHHFEPGMTEVSYRQEREQIRATYGDGSSKQARAAADQALAALFVRSSWTQERLAEEEKKPQSWVSNHVRFGHFLGFIPNEINPEWDAVHVQLTEGKFRAYWSQTEAGGGGDRPRFLAVQEALLADLHVSKSTTNKPKELGLAITQLADSQWHYEQTIIAHAQKVCAALKPPISVTATDVLAVLRVILKFGWHGVTAEKQKGAKGNRYRLVPKGRTMDADRFLHEVDPLFDELEDQVMKPLALQSKTRVKELMHLIRELAERLATTTRAPRTRGPAHQENV